MKLENVENYLAKSLFEGQLKYLHDNDCKTWVSIEPYPTPNFIEQDFDEILKAVKKIAQDVKENKIEINEITEETISNSLYTVGQPDPDLLIRTSGELRTSNFLPWQIVYSEFVFVEKNWPDFEEKDLDEAIEIYQKRNRKFGAK